jgi:putative membrane protein
MFDLYLWVKALHLIAVIFWMAGLLMLPRFFVYHSSAVKGGELETQMMEAERRLLKIIMNPAMIVSFLLGLILIGYNIGTFQTSLWLYVKVILALSLIGYHGFLSKMRKLFESGERPKSEKFFRMINEIPAVIAIVIVILAIVKPF